MSEVNITVSTDPTNINVGECVNTTIPMYLECKFQVNADSVSYLNSTDPNYSQVSFAVFAPLVAYNPKDDLEIFKIVMDGEGLKRETVEISSYGVNNDPAVVITGYSGRSLVGDIYLFRWPFSLGGWENNG